MKRAGPQAGLFFHLHPARVAASSLRPTATLGLGILSAVLFALLALSGTLLTLYYLPTTSQAYGSMLDIQYLVPLGGFLRTVHRWAAHLMVVTVALHLLRVVACAAYRGRARNWFIGLGLGASTLLLAFTGYLLPWDGRAYWAVRVSTGMLDNLPLAGGLLRGLLLGGDSVGAATLVRFYAAHVFFLPLLLLLLFVWHLWRLRRDGGLARPGEPEQLLPARPHLLVREAALALAACAVVASAAWLWPVELGAVIDTVRPADPEKAPWYFLGVQEMVSHSTLWGALLVPGLLTVFLAALPFADGAGRYTGVWWGAGRRRSLLAAVALLALLVMATCLWLEWRQLRPAGIHPSAVMTILALLAGVAGWLLARSRRAALLAFFVVMVVALGGFTLAGWWRGSGWRLLLPWAG